ncbi:MAG: hypothetical protein AAF645_19330 [Myxococcota bacterium]
MTSKTHRSYATQRWSIEEPKGWSIEEPSWKVGAEGGATDAERSIPDQGRRERNAQRAK